MSSSIVMNKSQLRKLAREYALGNLDERDYLQRRRALVDDIVSGQISIVREVPPPPPPAYSEDPTTKVSIGGRSGAQRLTPAALLIAVIVTAGVVWMLIPPGTQPGASIDLPAHAPPLSRARALIDEFVNEKDFSAFSIASFKESWSHLTYAEKREAYSAPWFNDLIHLISDEIEAQNELLGSENPADAAETGKRLSRFASFLGISEYVTEFKGLPARTAATVPPSASGPGVEAPAADALDTQQPLSSPALMDAGDTKPGFELASVNDAALGDPVAADAPASRLETMTLLAESDWLGAQPDGAFTLELYAANQLEDIQDLVASNPDIELQVLASERNGPRYRLVYGVFESEDAARVAYTELPEEIRLNQRAAPIKSLSRLLDEAGNADRIAVMESSQYTLQVFATDSADVARRLQADYPALNLSLLETTNPYTRYRVLYGIFDSEETAKRAAGALPLELLENVGDPSIKTASELQAVIR